MLEQKSCSGESAEYKAEAGARITHTRTLSPLSSSLTFFSPLSFLTIFTRACLKRLFLSHSVTCMPRHTSPAQQPPRAYMPLRARPLLLTLSATYATYSRLTQELSATCATYATHATYCRSCLPLRSEHRPPSSSARSRRPSRATHSTLTMGSTPWGSQSTVPPCRPQRSKMGGHKR